MGALPPGTLPACLPPDCPLCTQDRPTDNLFVGHACSPELPTEDQCPSGGKSIACSCLDVCGTKLCMLCRSACPHSTVVVVSRWLSCAPHDVMRVLICSPSVSRAKGKTQRGHWYAARNVSRCDHHVVRPNCICGLRYCTLYSVRNGDGVSRPTARNMHRIS